MHGGTICGVLFFFEAGFFVLAVAAIALGEVGGRGPALVVWAAITAASLAGRPLAQRRLARRPAADRVEDHWRRALGDSWRHLNVLLILGLLVLGAWWWIGSLVR